MKGTLISCIFVFLLAGCSVTKDWQATGGSKSDGTVRLSYETNNFEMVETSEAQALEEARKRCQAWGYKDAEAFGGELRQCNSFSGMGCNGFLVTKEYQCLDD